MVAAVEEGGHVVGQLEGGEAAVALADGGGEGVASYQVWPWLSVYSGPSIQPVSSESSMPVDSPRPNMAAYSSSRLMPSRRPASKKKTLQESRMASVTFTRPWSCSRRCRGRSSTGW